MLRIATLGRASHVVLGATLALVQSAGAQERPAPPRSDLASLTRSAEQRYPGLRAADHAIAAAEARLDEATISPFFQLNATGAFTLAPSAEGNPIFSPDSQLPLDNPWGPVVRASIEGAIPLYTFGKLSAARDAARAGIRAAELGRVQALARLRYDVRRAYFALQLALDVEQMMSEGRPRLERAIERLDEQLEEGTADVNEMDRWRLSSTLAEVEARASEAERLKQSSLAALRILTGRRDIRIPDCPIEPVEVEIAALEQYTRGALRQRPEAGMLQAGIAARDAELGATRARYFPDLALTLSASTSWGPNITDQSNPFVTDPANYDSLGAGIVARWSLDVWGNVFRERRAEAQLAEARARADEARQGMSLEVATAWHEAQDAKRRVDAWGRGHRDARAWFVAAGQAYELGAVEPRDLVDAVRTYFQARFNHLQAIRDYNTAIASLERVTGRDVLPASGWERSCEE